MGAAEDALDVIESVCQELAPVPAFIRDGISSMHQLRDLFQTNIDLIAGLETSNRSLSNQILGLEVKLEQETRALKDHYEAKVATLLTEVDKLQHLVQEARAEEVWITERVSQELHLPATNMRDLTERVLILIKEAKEMVKENLTR